MHFSTLDKVYRDIERKKTAILSFVQIPHFLDSFEILYLQTRYHFNPLPTTKPDVLGRRIKLQLLITHCAEVKECYAAERTCFFRCWCWNPNFTRLHGILQVRSSLLQTTDNKADNHDTNSTIGADVRWDVHEHEQHKRHDVVPQKSGGLCCNLFNYYRLSFR